MTTVELPFPPKALSPNARHGHWGAPRKAAKKYRADCYNAALAQGLRKMVADQVLVTLTFCPPIKRHHDADNLIARFKAGQDGLADLIGIDDRHWRMGKPIISDPFPPHGKVIVELEVA